MYNQKIKKNSNDESYTIQNTIYMNLKATNTT